MPKGVDSKRKVPFSGKQKRQQLQEKRLQRRERSRSQASSTRDDSDQETSRPHRVSKKSGHLQQNDGGDDLIYGDGLTSKAIARINAQPDDRTKDANRYALHFLRESDQELAARKKEASEPFQVIPEEELEVKPCDCWPTLELGLPKRPDWTYDMTTAEVDAREHASFKEYLEKIEAEYGSLSSLSHFELNLETWRQLWRVIEMADIVLLVVDIRHPIFHFPPSLYHHVVKDHGKEFVIVLNKCDLIPPGLVVAWIHYFRKTYPEIHVVPFASYAGMKIKSSKTKSRRFGHLKMASEACKKLYEVCKKIVGDKVNISNWIEKIEAESSATDEKHEGKEDKEGPDVAEHLVVKRDVSGFKHEAFRDGILTIGCVGHPNVGKSSVLNAIMGKKVVSVSRTPGHTKYFQTIFITPTVKLVDCPGLVFPSKIPKAMQVLMGCFPIAQVREPYSAIQYIAQRIDIAKILGLQHPDASSGKKQEDSSDTKLEWSAYDVCEAWAVKKGFRTAKAARPDLYRAANHLLRMAFDGRTLCLAFYPEGYVRGKDVWESHEDVASIKTLQSVKAYDSEEDSAPEIGSSHSPSHVDSDEEQVVVPARVPKNQGTSLNKFALLADDD